MRTTRAQGITLAQTLVPAVRKCGERSQEPSRQNPAFTELTVSQGQEGGDVTKTSNTHGVLGGMPVSLGRRRTPAGSASLEAGGECRLGGEAVASRRPW